MVLLANSNEVTTRFMESNGMMGRHDKELNSVFDEYDEDEYEDEDESYTEPDTTDAFDFESRPAPGIESFEDEEEEEDPVSSDSEDEFDDDFSDPFDSDDDDLDF